MNMLKSISGHLPIYIIIISIGNYIRPVVQYNDSLINDQLKLLLIFLNVLL